MNLSLQPGCRVRWLCRLAGSLALTAVGLATAATPDFEAVTIDPAIQIGYGLALADIDGDQRTDVVLADQRVIAWYRNGPWSRHVMAEKLTELDHVCVAAADLDGDGRAEVAAGAGWNPGDTFTSGALFYLKAPEDRTARWEPVRLAHDPTIHRIRWARDAQGRWSLLSLPLHGRGNKNGAGDGVRFLAYHPPRDPVAEPWTTTLLGDAWHATHNFEVFETGTGLNHDYLVAGREGVFRFHVTAAGRRIEPIASASTPEFIGAGEVRRGRISGSSGEFVATIEPMHGNQVAVYTRTGADPAAGWRRDVIDDSLVDGHGLVCGDFLGLGRDQVVAGWRAMNRPGARVGLRLYVPPDGPQGAWTRHVLDDGGMACEDLQAADLDGDGDLDLVAAGRGTKNLKLYLNRRR